MGGPQNLPVLLCGTDTELRRVPREAWLGVGGDSPSQDGLRVCGWQSRVWGTQGHPTVPHLPPVHGVPGAKEGSAALPLCWCPPTEGPYSSECSETLVIY